MDQPRRPNVIIIFTDDQGIGDVSCYGSEIPTPWTDSIGEQGVKFEQFYVAAPVCTPSRYGLLTGNCPERSQDKLLSPLMPTSDADTDRGVRPGEVVLPHMFREGGYRTGLVGKWHLGHADRKFFPTRHGFDYFCGHLAGCIDYWTLNYGNRPDWYRGEELAEHEGYATNVITDEAVRYIEDNRDDPFLLMISYNAPHYGKGWDDKEDEFLNILQAPRDYMDKFTHIEDPTRRTYAAMVACLDDGIGRVLSALRTQGLEDDTILIFTSDNGGSIPYGGCNTPFRGQKGTMFEGGIREPYVMRWPGRLEPGSRSQLVFSTLDMVETLAAFTGCDASEYQTDGMDLSQEILGGTTRERDLFWSGRKHVAMRQGDLKYVLSEEGEFLFDLGDDPAETTNLNEREQEEFGRLKEACEDTLASMSADTGA
ncbi:MAG: sulfatase-like hydrolase/transferase [Armatimonadota bacterium]|jgi:arylsulfatase A-like enzyme